MTRRKPEGVEALLDSKAERQCVGWLLAKPNEWEAVTEVVAPDDFVAPDTRDAFTDLLLNGYQSVQVLSAKYPDTLDKGQMSEWARDARDFLNPRSVREIAAHVANISLRRRVWRDANDSTADALDFGIDEIELVARIRERAERADAPDAPPIDPAETVDQFMAGEDDDYDWVIDDLLERRDRMLITATGGVGKSTLLRQIAVSAAAGRHPFTTRTLRNGPARVLLLDLENSKRQVRRKLRPILEVLHPEPHNLHIVAKPQVMDVTTAVGWRWLSGQCQLAKPDLIVGGPVYRLYEGGDASKDMGGRDKARMVVNALDKLRDRFNCALVVEAHPPKGSSSLSPHGSAVWEWWPEFGCGLQPSADGPDEVEWKHWRYPRDDRTFPETLWRGGTWGWKSV